MRASRSALLACIASLVASLGAARADELTVGFGLDKPPFVIGQEKKGLEIDIFTKALAYKGHTLKIVHMPNQRLNEALRIMLDIDAVATVRQTPGDGWFYVDQFIYFDNCAIGMKKDHLSIRNVADLKGLSIVAWQNAYRDLGPEFENLFRPSPPAPHKKLYSEIPSQKAQNQMFWGRHAQVIVIDKTIFRWYRHQLASQMDTTPDIEYFPIFSGKTYYQAAFRNKKLAMDFEAGLKHIKSTGLYDRLYEEWAARGIAAP